MFYTQCGHVDLFLYCTLCSIYGGVGLFLYIITVTSLSVCHCGYYVLAIPVDSSVTSDSYVPVTAVLAEVLSIV